MTTEIVQGNNCVCQFNTTGVFKTLVCSKSFSISVETETKETTTRGDAGWRDYDYKTLGYTLTLSGLLKIIDSSGDNTYHDLLIQQVNFLEVNYRIIYTDPSGNISLIAGTVLITRSTLNTPAGSQVESDIELLGKGSFGLFQIQETNTVDFQVQSTLFDSTNNLTEGEKTYKLTDSRVLLTTNLTSSQQVSVSYLVPKIAGVSFDADYSVNTVGTGILNPTASASSSGSNWSVIATFDFNPATSNKIYQLLPN